MQKLLNLHFYTSNTSTTLKAYTDSSHLMLALQYLKDKKKMLSLVHK